MVVSMLDIFYFQVPERNSIESRVRQSGHSGFRNFDNTRSIDPKIGIERYVIKRVCMRVLYVSR